MLTHFPTLMAFSNFTSHHSNSKHFFQLAQWPHGNIAVFTLRRFQWQHKCDGHLDESRLQYLQTRLFL